MMGRNSSYITVKESIYIVFIYSFLLKWGIINVLLFLADIFLNLDNPYTFIIVNSSIIVIAWGIAIYFAAQYIRERKTYNDKPQYKVSLNGMIVGTLCIILDRTLYNLIASLAYSYVEGEWKFMWHLGYMDQYTLTQMIAAGISMCIVAPIAEEYFYRGILLKGLTYKYSAGTSIIISTLLFSAIHLVNGNIISAFTGGIILGYLYTRYKSLGLCIVVHIGANIVTMLDPTGYEMLYGSLTVLGLLFIIKLIAKVKVYFVH